MKGRFSFLIVLLAAMLALSGMAEGSYLSAQTGVEHARYIGAEILSGTAYTWEAYSSTLYAISEGGQTVAGYAPEASCADMSILTLFSYAGSLHSVAARSDGDRLDVGVYKLNPMEGQILGFEKVGSLDFNGLNAAGGFQIPDVSSAAMADGKLFAIIAPSGGASQSYAFALDTGARSDFDMDVRAFLATNGNLVMLVAQEGESAGLYVFDASSRQGEKLCDLPSSARSFSYDTTAGKLYFLDDGLYRVDSPSDPRGTRIANIPFVSASQIASDGTLLIAVQDNDVYFSAIGDVPADVQTLSVYGTVSQNILNGFMAQNPDINVNTLPLQEASIVLSNALAHDSSPDLYWLLSINAPYFASLRDREYLAEITDPVAIAWVESVHEDIRQECYDANGVLRAIPVSMLVNNELGINRELWNELGLGEQPNTWNELFDFLEKWCEIGNNYPDISLLGYASAEETRMMFGYALRNDYDAYRRVAPDHPSYDTELYRQLLHRLNDVNFENLRYDQQGGNTLMTDMYLPSPENSLFADTSFDMLHLSVDGITPSSELANVYFLGVNSSSQNIDLAMRLVSYCASEIPAEDCAMLCPAFDSAIFSAQYEQQMNAFREQEDAVLRQMEASDDPAEQEALRLQLEFLTQQQNDYLNSNAYAISEDSLAKYKDDVRDGLLVSYGESVMDPAVEQNLADVHARFVAGMMSVEDYTRALDQILHMQELEQQ